MAETGYRMTSPLLVITSKGMSLEEISERAAEKWSGPCEEKVWVGLGYEPVGTTFRAVAKVACYAEEPSEAQKDEERYDAIVLIDENTGKRQIFPADFYPVARVVSKKSKGLNY